jgi:hypothetical protein
MTVESAAPAADSAPLSVDSAVGLLVAAPASQTPVEQPKKGAAPAEAAADQVVDQVDTEIPADTTAEEAEGAQDLETDPALEASEEGEGDVEPAQAPAIEAPTSWDAEAKALFAQLPAELQTKVAGIQAQRDRETTQALERAVETTRRAEAQASHVGQFKAALDQLLPRAQQVFAGRWDGIDWAAEARADPVATYQAQLQMQAEQQELGRLQAAHEHANQLAYSQFLAAEDQKLPKLVPELADPEKGPARRKELAAFLVGAGIPEQMLGGIDAVQTAIAYDAMRYRQLKAQAAAQLKKPAPAARPGQRPTAPPPGSPQQRTAAVVANRFAQTRSVNDAVAVLLSRKTG